MKQLKNCAFKRLLCALLCVSVLLLTACSTTNPVVYSASGVADSAMASGYDSSCEADAEGDEAGTEAELQDPDTAAQAVAAGGAEETSTDRIHFIRLDTDVTSDSFLIESQGKYMLVDTSNPDPTTNGNYSVYVNTENVRAVIEYLDSLGITHLDYLVMTHNHSDHIGGVTTLCNLHFIDENTVVFSRTGKETQEDIDTPEWQNQYYYQLAVDALNGVGAEFHSLLEEHITDLTIKLGNFDVKFMNLDLDGDGQVDFDDQNENNNSLVLKISRGDMDTLLTADIETEQEYALVDACDLSDIEVLKVPHHGSTTSSSYEFLKEIQPETAIVTSFRYRQGGAHRYLQDVVGTDIYVTQECTAGAIVETVYDDHYTIDNGVLYEDSDTDTSHDGWLSWFDYYMYNEAGTLLTDCWKKISGEWYHFDGDGLMQTGYITLDGKNYYLDSDGQMQTGFVTIDGKRHFFSIFDGAEITIPLFGGNQPGPSPAPSDAPAPSGSSAAPPPGAPTPTPSSEASPPPPPYQNPGT